MTEVKPPGARELWREYNRREAWADRLAWALLPLFGGWALVGQPVELGLTMNGHDTAGDWAFWVWAVDGLLCAGYLMVTTGRP